MAIDECMDVRRQFQSRSHSFGSFGASPPTVMAIFPSFVMSIRTFSTPAARTARIARVMSACRNVEGARAMGLPLRSLLIGCHLQAPLVPSQSRVTEIGHLVNPLAFVIELRLEVAVRDKLLEHLAKH